MKKILIDVLIALGVSAFAILLAMGIRPERQRMVRDTSIETDDTVSSHVANVRKNKAFENFVIEKFDFTRDGYTLLEQNDETEKTRADLLVEIECDMQFYPLAIECLWVETLSSKGVYWANDAEMKRIMESAEAEGEAGARLYLALGVGGTPTSPKLLYIVPIHYHYEHILTAQQLSNFEIKVKPDMKFNYNGKLLTLE